MTRGSRSPSCPSKSLETRYKEAQKIYEIYPNAAFDRAQMANCLGVSSQTGSFNTMVSDLRQYGLIDKTADRGYVISAAVKDLSIASPEEALRIRYKLATTPEVFCKIISTQGNHLPPVANLQSLLVAKHGFSKARACDAAKALWASLQWAQAIDAKGNVIEPSEQPVAEPVPALESGQETSADYQLPAPSVPSSDLLTLDIALKDERMAKVLYPHDLTTEEAKKISAILAALTA